ncbi:protein DOUBLE-STRAND BREAK FORMATION isoform X2 [Mercurialis annua]|uniref:protein DOUBLE-STRAND BREAK FORMATION isoform X2 n=1 Tax=Mercurialis annua TaxID=3986 RepID=UPI002160338F|nr:protein DOUBLE-STRAND BREAK FORMATION isoform X2 [Mercurialis annua]
MADSNAYNQNKRLRTHSAYTTPSPFHPPPAPLWPLGTAETIPGNHVPQLLISTPAPMPATGSYTHVQSAPLQKNNSIAEPISFFCSQITNRRLDSETLLILESLMVCKDVKPLLELRSNLKEFMRSQSISILCEIKENKNTDLKLLILEFFVRAFALIGDMQSCLALKYEAFLLRKIKSSSGQFLQVSRMEWLNFAEQLIENGFCSTAIQACENAMLCLQMDEDASAVTDHSSGNERIRRLKDLAVKFAGSSSGSSNKILEEENS